MTVPAKSMHSLHLLNACDVWCLEGMLTVNVTMKSCQSASLVFVFRHELFALWAAVIQQTQSKICQPAIIEIFQTLSAANTTARWRIFCILSSWRVIMKPQPQSAALIISKVTLQSTLRLLCSEPSEEIFDKHKNVMATHTHTHTASSIWRVDQIRSNQTRSDQIK